MSSADNLHKQFITQIKPYGLQVPQNVGPDQDPKLFLFCFYHFFNMQSLRVDVHHYLYV